MPKANRRICILGIRGIPARHGGFETFTEHFAIYLQQKGWQVSVYCQEKGKGKLYEDIWRGIHLIHIPVRYEGAIATVIFDWKSTVHAVKAGIPVLTLGYNTAVFFFLYSLSGQRNIVNTDGIEWQRGKWSILKRIWLYLNEKAAYLLSTHIIADHPEISRHLRRFVASSKITVIPYGAAIIEDASESLLIQFGLKKGSYALVIARPEPENSVREIVTAYCRKKRGIPLVILGNYTPDHNVYHKSIIELASKEIMFLGAIYDAEQVQALRFFSRFYIHGHTVGGTNPSLVEALGAGSPILAHDNIFNRWVAGDGACYFSTVCECASMIENLIDDDNLLAYMKKYSFKRAKEKFTLDVVHQKYEQTLTTIFNF